MLRILLYIVGGLAVLTAVFMLVFNFGKGEVLGLKIRDVDLTKVPDGVYTGSYSKGRWGYTVRVTVAGGRIGDIEIANCKNQKIYTDLNNAITAKVIEAQKLGIDTVSGASINTKAFLKAVDNALPK